MAKKKKNKNNKKKLNESSPKKVVKRKTPIRKYVSLSLAQKGLALLVLTVLSPVSYTHLTLPTKRIV